jgi:hypothetical protein
MGIRGLYIYLALIACTLLAGCDKDVNEFTPSPVTDTTWVQQISNSSAVVSLADTLQLSPLTDSIELSEADTVFLDSIQCVVPPGGLAMASGSPYTGVAEVQCLLLDKPGDWVRAFMGTTFQGKLIKTGAALYVSITAQGVSLQPTQTVELSFLLQNPFQGQTVWSGAYTQHLLEWKTAVSSASLTSAQNIITLTTPTLGWFLYGALLDPGTGSLTVTLPTSFSNANTAVFCVLPDDRALAVLQGDAGTRTFVASGLPGGVNATIVSITFTGDVFYLASQTVTLASGSTEVRLTPAVQSLTYITSYLEQL